MNTSKAIRNFYRISLKLTNDVERAVQNASVPRCRTQALVSEALKVCHLHTPQQNETMDVKSLVRASYRDFEAKAPMATNKEKIEAALEGIRRLEGLLMDIQSDHKDDTASGGKMQRKNNNDRVDDSWTSSMIQQVKWLPCLANTDTPHNDENKDGVTSNENNNDYLELPMIPLTQPFFALNEAFHLFTRFAPWEFPMPGHDVELYIREPRYLDLYTKTFSTFWQRMTAQKSGHAKLATAGIHTAARPYSRHFVVPFAHPHQRGTFATHGILFEVKDWTSMRGPAGLVYQCQHIVSHPVVIHRVVNPDAFTKEDTYLRAQVTVLDSYQHKVFDSDSVHKALVQSVEASFASQCQLSLQTSGVWAFLEKWHSFLQQSIQQLELHLGQRVLLAVRASRQEEEEAEVNKRSGTTAPPPLAPEILAHISHEVHKPFRYRLLKLKLALALSIPRILQAKSNQERKDVLLGLIAALF